MATAGCPARRVARGAPRSLGSGPGGGALGSRGSSFGADGLGETVEGGRLPFLCQGLSLGSWNEFCFVTGSHF